MTCGKGNAGAAFNLPSDLSIYVIYDSLHAAPHTVCFACLVPACSACMYILTRVPGPRFAGDLSRQPPFA